MPHGPGKYDDLCTSVRHWANATVAIVIVVDGNRGSGFSIQAHDEVSPSKLAAILETIVKEIRESERNL